MTILPAVINELQRKGGTYLLFYFLSNKRFVVLVGGANGMVCLINGRAVFSKPSKAEFMGSYAANQIAGLRRATGGLKAFDLITAL
jgi:hypothetical protein